MTNTAFFCCQRALNDGFMLTVDHEGEVYKSTIKITFGDVRCSFWCFILVNVNL